MSSKSIPEVAEAVCGAIARWNQTFDVQFLGDRGPSTWFVLGHSPKIMRVEVLRSALAPMVIVNMEWPVLPRDGHGFQRGRMTAQIDVKETDDKVLKQIELVLLRVLSVFQDVVSESGLGLGKLEADMDVNHTLVDTDDIG